MTRIKKIIVLIIVLLGLAQFIPHEREDVNSDPSRTFAAESADEVNAILRTACFDCHSNETQYPWYADLAPVSFWMDRHIEHAREKLNFSEWTSYPAEDRQQLSEKVVKMVGEKQMPLLSYWIVHWDAKISDEQRQTLIAYFEGI